MAVIRHCGLGQSSVIMFRDWSKNISKRGLSVSCSGIDSKKDTSKASMGITSVLSSRCLRPGIRKG